MVRIVNDSKKLGNTVYIDEDYTEAAIIQLRRCIKDGIVRPDKVHFAHIYFDCNKDTPLTESDRFPLKATGTSHNVFISGVAAGFSGEATNGTLECLKMLGFKLSPSDEDRILTKTKVNGVESHIISAYFSK